MLDSIISIMSWQYWLSLIILAFLITAGVLVFFVMIELKAMNEDVKREETRMRIKRRSKRE